MCVKKWRYEMRMVVRIFFKQKTAYEMRISDWSSDVCSSDLPGARQRARQLQLEAAAVQQAGQLVRDGERFQIADAGALQGQGLFGLRGRGQQAIQQFQARRVEALRCRLGMTPPAIRGRADLRQGLLLRQVLAIHVCALARDQERKSVVEGRG